MIASVAIVTLVTGAVAALVLTTVGAARRAPLPAWLLAVPPALWAVAIGGLAVGVTRGRALVAATDLVSGEPGANATALASGISAQIDLLPLVGAALTWTPLLYGAAAVVLVAVRGARARRPIAPGILLAVAVAVPLSIAGIVVSFWCLRVVPVWAGLGAAAPEDKPKIAAKAFSAAAADLAMGRRALAVGIGFAAALAVGAALLAARRRITVSTRASGLVVALFACAVAAFAATRAMAHDAAQPLDPIDSSGLISGKTILRVPHVDHCDELLEMAPIVDVGDGIVVSGQQTTLAGFGDLLGTMRRNSRLLHPNDPPAVSVVLLVPADRRAAELAPALAAIRESGFDYVQAAVIVPHDVDTRTLGHLARASECRRTVALARPFAPAAGATWSEFLHDTR
jgi:hypothetical protein